MEMKWKESSVWIVRAEQLCPRIHLEQWLPFFSHLFTNHIPKCSDSDVSLSLANADNTKEIVKNYEDAIPRGSIVTQKPKETLNFENNNENAFTGIRMLLAASFIADISVRLPVLPGVLSWNFSSFWRNLQQKVFLSPRLLFPFLFSQKAFQLLFNLLFAEDRSISANKVLNSSCIELSISLGKPTILAAEMPFYSQNMFHLGPGYLARITFPSHPPS